MAMDASFSPAWLARHPVESASLRQAWSQRLTALSVPPHPRESILASAVAELRSGLKALLGLQLRRTSSQAGRGITLAVLGTGEPQSFSLTVLPESLRLTASDEVGLLYGVFRLLEQMALGRHPEGLVLADGPRCPLRMFNHWDNLDGSIERGYAGRSFFFRNGKVLPPGPRLRAYARLAASVGLNAVAINNVNVHGPETRLIAEGSLKQLAQVARVLRAWGVRLYLSVNFASPITLGGLDTADPLDPRVIRWWEDRARLIWSVIPDFGGFVVKADSEGRPGPFTYGRDHADGANLLARAVAPYGGTIFWRCFVYNCRQDWRDRTTDRARAAYDHFRPLDGRFLPNVCLQIKNGPMDFQPREPLSPLFGALAATSTVLELQATQEYTGQQRHLCYLPEQWSVYLGTETGPQKGQTLASAYQGITAVANLGDDANWTGHDLAQANWYGFGRLAWNPADLPDQIAREWAVLTFGPDPLVAETVTAMLLGSWQAYEDYTAPLGLGWMVNPQHHYGPNPDGYEYDRWGTYHFADRDGVGVDRTQATGTGYTAQYRPWTAALYEDPATCPEALLLFFHHLPYSHRLKSGTTILQHFYDSHFSGADRAAALVERWASLQGRVEPHLYQAVAERLAHQREHAALWRDVVNTYFFRKSGQPDGRGRPIHP